MTAGRPVSGPTVPGVLRAAMRLAADRQLIAGTRTRPGEVAGRLLGVLPGHGVPGRTRVPGRRIAAAQGHDDGLKGTRAGMTGGGPEAVLVRHSVRGTARVTADRARGVRGTVRATAGRHHDVSATVRVTAGQGHGVSGTARATADQGHDVNGTVRVTAGQHHGVTGTARVTAGQAPRRDRDGGAAAGRPARYERAGGAADRPARYERDRGEERRATTRGLRAPRLELPEGIGADQLDPQARAELRTLPGQLAEAVAAWLVAAAAEQDPDRAFEFAVQARKLAARVGVVRETAGVAAYRAGRWADALAELRTARRLTGRVSYLPLMADAERALGRSDRALALIHDPDSRQLDRATQIELAIVESGIRRDQGRAAAAVVVLQLPELTDGVRRPWSARLFYAYADALYDAGRLDEAREWFGRAAAADPDEETDAAERYEIMDSVVIEDLDEPDDEPDLDRSARAGRPSTSPTWRRPSREESGTGTGC